MILEKLQLIDRVECIDVEEQEILCSSTIPDKSPVFEGHFPYHPILPGVFMIEAMAQAAGFLCLHKLALKMMPFLIAVDKIRCRAFAGPGDRLSITARLTHEGSGFAAFGAVLKREGRTLSDGELRLAIRPFPDERMRQHIGSRMSEIGISAPWGVSVGDDA